MIPTPKLLTTSEVASCFRVKSSTISRWVSRGIIPKEYVHRPSGFSRGSRILIDEQAVQLLLKNPKEPDGLKHQRRHADDGYEALWKVF